MKYKLYQIQTSKIGELGFERYANLEAKGIKVDRSNYDMVYEGEFNGNLEHLFQTFNMDRPEDFTGASMSVSDVIEIFMEDGIRSYYVDSFGFKKLDEF